MYAIKTDVELMNSADDRRNLAGTYYGKSFTGQGYKSRWNSVMECEDLYVKMDEGCEAAEDRKTTKGTQLYQDIIISGTTLRRGGSYDLFWY